jgi:hypothetical protein
VADAGNAIERRIDRNHVLLTGFLVVDCLADAHAPLQPRRMRRNHGRHRDRQSGSQAHRHQLRRAGQPVDPQGLRRFTRLTNAFSRKVENHFDGLVLSFMYDNVAHIRQTLRMSPAMAAGVSKTPWSMEDVVRIIEG